MKPAPRTAIDRAVLIDRLQLALAAPGRAASWHWLFRGCAAAAEADREAILAALRRRRPAGAAGAILCATLLDGFCADESELARASRAYLQSKLPVDAGLALLNLSYARALRSGGSSEGLVSLLRRAGFLALSRHVGTRLLPKPGARPERAARQAGKPRRIAVVAPTLSTGYHAPTRMALAHAVLLRDQDFAVQVFAPQEQLMPGMPQWLGTPREMALSAPDPRTWPRSKRGGMPITTGRMELSMRGRWMAMLRAIDQFDPDAVLFVGPFSPLLWPLQARYPVAGLGTHALEPVGPLDLWLAPDAAARPVWKAAWSPKAMCAHTQRISVRLAKSPQPRAELGLPENGVVWITSTTMVAKDLPPGWCARILEALERHPKAHWLVVGKKGELPPHLPADHPRVSYTGFKTELGAVLLACDLYLNPPRMGGGASVAMAMAHGVPVLSMGGSDGGDKVGPQVMKDEAAYLRTLDAWTRDKATRREAGEVQRERFQRRFDLDQAGPALAAAMEQAIRVKTGQ